MVTLRLRDTDIFFFLSYLYITGQKWEWYDWWLRTQDQLCLTVTRSQQFESPFEKFNGGLESIVWYGHQFSGTTLQSFRKQPTQNSFCLGWSMVIRLTQCNCMLDVLEHTFGCVVHYKCIVAIAIDHECSKLTFPFGKIWRWTMIFMWKCWIVYRCPSNKLETMLVETRQAQLWVHIKDGPSLCRVLTWYAKKPVETLIYR